MRQRARLRVSFTGLVVSLGGITCATGVAHAELSMERFPGATACEEAASYDEGDTSPTAERARRRCRLEDFEARYAEKRAQVAEREEAARVRRIEKWTAAEVIPARVARPLAVDGFVGGGISNYGLAVSWLLLRRLELEGWFGNHSRLGGWGYGSYLNSSPRCRGVRGKWLFFDNGNFTPFFALGGTFCNSDVDGASNDFNPNGSSQLNYISGQAKAHLATFSLGLTFTTEIGLRFSLEYLYAYAVYTQASSNQQADSPHSETIRALWATQMSDTAGGLRLQVGYAF